MNAFALRDYQERLPATAGQDDAVARFRQRAFEDLAAQGLPTPKTEDWKYTRVRKLIAEDLIEPDATAPVAVPRHGAKHLAVMVNGRLNGGLSKLDDLPAGVTVRALGEALSDSDSDAKSLLGQVVRHDKHPFAALNGAYFADGLFIDVAPGATVPETLTVLWMSRSGEPASIEPRLLVRVGDNAQFALMEQHQGSETAHLTNQVSEIIVADNARFAHVRMQHTGAERLICGTHVECRRDSHYRAQTVDLGGALIRNDLLVSLVGPGAEADTDGVFLCGEDHHVDNHIRIDHIAPRCDSHALYKGLLANGGRGVFNGKLVVHPDGQKTNARQVNHNLLLTPGVEIDTKPELEIYADDVKCSHGSTSGELDEDHLFYLRSRGIDQSSARILLVRAFAGEILERLADETLRGVIGEEMEPALETLIQDVEGV